MSVNSKMTALADEIRELSGTTEAIGLDAMKIHVGEANDAISVQSNLISEQDAKIAELAQVLAGKASGGSNSVETCTGTFQAASAGLMDGPAAVTYTNQNGMIVTEDLCYEDTFTVVKNSMVCVGFASAVKAETGCTRIAYTSMGMGDFQAISVFIIEQDGFVIK